MAYKATIFSPLNTLTLVPETGDDIFLGHDILTNRLPYNLNYMRKKHAQYVELSDPIVIQLHTTAAEADVTANIIDCAGNNLFELDISYGTGSVPVYRTYDEAGDTVLMNTNQYNFRFADYFDESDEGLYSIRINIQYDIVTSTSFIAEVINLKVSHPDTQLLQYGCDVNRLETLFELFNTGFARRFPFKIGAIEPQREESDFISQAQKLVKVTSYPYNLYQFHFKNITDYEVQALNYILACDKFRVNTQVFVSDDEIDLEQSGISPLYQGTITVRDAELNQSFTYQAADTIILFSWNDFPFNVFSNIMDDGFNGIGVVPGARVFEGLADVETLRDELNNVIKPQQGLQGTFSISGDQLRYTNGVGEKYQVTENIIATKRLVCTIETFADDQDFRFFVREFCHCIEWGDGIMTAVNIETSTDYVVYAHRYQTTGTFDMVFWWASHPISGFPTEGTGLKFIPFTNPLGGTAGPVLTNIVGLGNATRMRELQILYADFSAVEINLDWLKDSYLFMDNLQILYSSMDDFASSSFLLNGGLKWAMMRSINFGSNTLPVANINTILQQLQANLTFPTPTRTIFLKNQTPAAAPTGTGLTAKNLMVAAGWNVQTD